MSITLNGETLSADMQPEQIVEGQEYRVIYTRDYHNFEFIGRALADGSLGRSIRMEIVRWVRESADGSWGERQYPVGYVWGAASNTRTHTDPQNLILPVTPPAPPTPTDSAFDGQQGEFLPHDGQVPESGSIVRGLNTDTRQVEGLFLRMDGEAEATVEAKRRRRVNSNGTFGEWESYENTTRRNVRVEGATVFKPGATPADMPEIFYERGAVVDDRGESLRVGDVVSAVGYSKSDHIYRGTFVRTHSDAGGRVVIMATHSFRSTDVYNTDGIYPWVKLSSPTEVTVWMDRSEARQRWNRAGWRWAPLAPGVKPLDPAFDPKRKTSHTGMGIGDVVVGRTGGRDTVSSWVRGEIVKWHGSSPVVKVTDKMESAHKVGAEVVVDAGDTYPALADPKGADPDEFKKTLRLYLIGRHKHGDFCQGGLNTMLAAFGIPLYEKRRRSTMVVTIDYDPNGTDLYEVQRQLQANMSNVSGVQISERDGTDFEIEADVTAG